MQGREIGRLLRHRWRLSIAIMISLCALTACGRTNSDHFMVAPAVVGLIDAATLETVVPHHGPPQCLDSPGSSEMSQQCSWYAQDGNHFYSLMITVTIYRKSADRA